MDWALSHGHDLTTLTRTLSPPCPLRILLVDDHAPDLTLAQEAVTALNHWVELVTADGGPAALAYLRTPHRPPVHLVLLDVTMTAMSGFDVLEAIKADPGLCALPVVMLSLSERPADVTRAYHLHASAYVIKEMELTSFLTQVRDIARYWRWCQPMPSTPDSPSTK